MSLFLLLAGCKPDLPFTPPKSTDTGDTGGAQETGSTETGDSETSATPLGPKVLKATYLDSFTTIPSSNWSTVTEAFSTLVNSTLTGNTVNQYGDAAQGVSISLNDDTADVAYLCVKTGDIADGTPHEADDVVFGFGIDTNDLNTMSQVDPTYCLAVSVSHNFSGEPIGAGLGVSAQGGVIGLSSTLYLEQNDQALATLSSGITNSEFFPTTPETQTAVLELSEELYALIEEATRQTQTYTW